MRKLVLGMCAGVVGTREYEFYLVPDSISQGQLDAFAWARAVEHAENYGIYYDPEGDLSEDGDPVTDMEGWFEDYNPDKHDGYSTSGVPDWQGW